MKIWYADAALEETIGERKEKTMELHYILELSGNDEDARIIGGEWAKENQDWREHPDFVWVALEPIQFEGDPNAADSRKANPYIDSQVVINLWRRSIQAPNAPEDIKEPVWRKSWGKFAEYEVLIDGSESGAVFLGKEIKLQIISKATDFLQGTLEITLNNRKIRDREKVSSETTDLVVKPQAGMNWIEVSTELATGKKRTDTVVFHAL